MRLLTFLLTIVALSGLGENALAFNIGESTQKVPQFSELVDGAALNSFATNCDSNRIAPQLRQEAGLMNRKATISSCEEGKLPDSAQRLCKKTDHKVYCESREGSSQYVCFVDPRIQRSRIPASQNSNESTEFQPRYSFAFLTDDKNGTNDKYFKMDQDGCQTKVYSDNYGILRDGFSSNDVQREDCLRVADYLAKGSSKVAPAKSGIPNYTLEENLKNMCGKNGGLAEKWRVDNLMSFIASCSEGFPYLYTNREVHTQLRYNLPTEESSGGGKEAN